MTPIHHVVVTHKEIEWRLPFPHQVITVGQYREEGALQASEYMSSQMSRSRAAAFFRFIPPLLDHIKSLPDNTPISVMNHRSFWRAPLFKGISRPKFETEIRRAFTPSQFYSEWQSMCILEFPDEVDAIVCNPVNLGISVLEQYANAHHLDDLLFGFGLAIRMGIISEKNALYILSKPLAVHGIILHKSRAMPLYSKIWQLTQALFEDFLWPRKGYQERSINFVVERVSWALYLVEISRPGSRVSSAHLGVIAPDGRYVPGE